MTYIYDTSIGAIWHKYDITSNDITIITMFDDIYIYIYNHALFSLWTKCHQKKSLKLIIWNKNIDFSDTFIELFRCIEFNISSFNW